MAPPESWKPKEPRPDYRLTPTHVWRTRLRGLSLGAKALYSLLTTGPNTTAIPGLVAGYQEELAGQLECPLEDFRQAFAELEAAGIAEADWRAGLVWLPPIATDDPPTGPNVVKGWRRMAQGLPQCQLLTKALQAIYGNVSGHLAFPAYFQKAFQDTFLVCQNSHGGGGGGTLPLPDPDPYPNTGEEACVDRQAGPPPPSPPPSEFPDASVIPLHQPPKDVEVAELRQAWNEACPELPRWRDTPPDRVRAARNALKRRPMAEWREVFKLIHESDFCRGSTGWRATIDWALRAAGKKPEPARNVLEGVYANRQADVKRGRHRAEDSVHDYPLGPHGRIQIS